MKNVSWGSVREERERGTARTPRGEELDHGGSVALEDECVEGGLRRQHDAVFRSIQSLRGTDECHQRQEEHAEPVRGLHSSSCVCFFFGRRRGLMPGSGDVTGAYPNLSRHDGDVINIFYIFIGKDQGSVAGAPSSFGSWDDQLSA